MGHHAVSHCRATFGLVFANVRLRDVGDAAGGWLLALVAFSRPLRSRLAFTPPPKPPSQGGFGLNILSRLLWALRLRQLAARLPTSSLGAPSVVCLVTMRDVRLLLQLLIALAPAPRQPAPHISGVQASVHFLLRACLEIESSQSARARPRQLNQSVSRCHYLVRDEICNQ